MAIIKRGEIWLVNLDPTVGAEIRKTRPVVVLSSDALGKLPVKLVAPLTEWKDYLAQNIWHVKITPDATNGLTKPSSVDTLQLRGVDTQRFVRKIGNISTEVMENITVAVVTVIEHEPI
ncbi:MAG TPA: type II toxin-antitoxin system PemK/MazF family toxin [Chloroflexota bacterium]|nr:type II toxin-antitoxin system PemK/MazF family toxin [Chloroflexota bacterium]HUM72556.1 type II toxin-antitoxin system PemK/MazF family toxin [Chloroflexota bacterium]